MRSLEVGPKEGPRAEILACVQSHPGAHLRGIERMTALPLGQVLYHLDRLERMGVLGSKREGGFRRYYPTATVDRREKKYLAALRQDTTRAIVLAILDEGPLPHKWIQDRLELAGSTLSFHLQRLTDAGVLVREPRGPLNVYHLSDPDLARHEVIYYRESFHDEQVDRYVRNQIARLPPHASPAPQTATAPAATTVPS